MQLPPFITHSLGWAAFEFARIQPLVPTYLHLIASALFPIYAGAHASLSRPSSAAKKEKKKRLQDTDEKDEDEDEETQRMEGLSASDALLFPLLAGVTLTGLYFLIKWLQDPTLLNKILGWYFAGFSVFSVSRLVSDSLDVLHCVLFPHSYVDQGVLYHVNGKARMALPSTPGPNTRSSPLPYIFSRLPLPRVLLNLFWTLQGLPNRKLRFESFIRGIYDVHFKLGIHGIEGLLVGISTVLWYNLVSKPWWLTNLMGFGFAYGTLQLLSPTTFGIGTLMLCGLFFYDIYMVFFTPMMVTVAKSLDIPIKLLFPRPSSPDEDPAKQALSMLGLGDVVLPGIMIGLALRFDLYLFYLRKQSIRSEDATTTGKEEEGAEKGTIEDSKSKDGPTTASNVTIKAPYVSVAEAWGDRVWTSYFLTRSTHGYVAANIFPKTYFHASLVGYTVGMIATLVAMQISDHAQPALLYLVPGVLTSLWTTAWAKGEFPEMWKFSDAEEEEKPKSEEEDSKDITDREDVRDNEKEAGIKKKSILSPERSDARVKKVEKTLSSPDYIDDESRKNKENKDLHDSTHRENDRRLIHFSVSLPPLCTDCVSDEPSAESRYNFRGKKSSADERAEKRQRVS